MNAPHPLLQASKSVSLLERVYGVFDDATIQVATSSKLSAAPLMIDLNRAHQIISGLGVVLRMVSGNSTLKDRFDPDAPGSVPPLSRTAEDMLTTMAAAICEELCDSMESRADTYNDQVQS